jgi:hypothetical protein
MTLQRKEVIKMMTIYKEKIAVENKAMTIYRVQYDNKTIDWGTYEDTVIVGYYTTREKAEEVVATMPYANAKIVEIEVA